jgi:hypothetical protein
MATGNFSISEGSNRARTSGWLDRMFGLTRPLVAHPGITAFAFFSLVLAFGASSSVFRFANALTGQNFSVEDPRTLALLTNKDQVRADSPNSESDETALPAKPATPPTITCAFHFMAGVNQLPQCEQQPATSSHQGRANRHRQASLTTCQRLSRKGVTRPRQCGSGSIAGLSGRSAKEACCRS